MRRRLTAVAAAVTSMVVLAFLVPLAGLVRTIAVERALQGAEVQLAALAPVVGAVDDEDALRLSLDAAAARTAADLSVHLPDGGRLGADLPDDELVARARSGEAFTAEVAGGRDVLLPVLTRAGEVAVLRARVPAADLTAGVAASWAVLGGLGVALVAGAVLLADRLARSTVRPVSAIAATARRLGDGDLAARAPEDGPEEVADVAVALNTLAGRIRGLLAAEREAAADLSHRLRTPLTALRLDVEAVGDPRDRARLTRDLDDLERAVDRAIRDARRVADEPRPSGDLGAVVRDRAAFWAALAEDQGRPWAVDVPEGPHPVAVPADELEALVDALLNNVFAHTPEGTAFRLRVEALPGGARRLVVEDDGPGLTASSVARGVSGAGSTGLGLDIVRRTAASSGGAVRLPADAAGGRVEVELGPAVLSES